MASTTWETVIANNTRSGQNVSFAELTGTAYIHRNLHKFRDLQRRKNQSEKLPDFTLFMNVRHPFDRLVSAYFDKAFPTRMYDGEIKGFHRIIRDYALKNYEHGNLTGLQREIYNASFQEFIDYSFFDNDRHWHSLETFCDPCHFEYKYFLRVETMGRDSQILMSDLYPDAGPIPFVNVAQKKSYSDSSTSQLIQPKTLDIFSQLPRKTLKKLMKKYAWDLKFYGYSFDTKTFKADCNFKDYNCC